jgi:hypothetical protein
MRHDQNGDGPNAPRADITLPRGGAGDAVIPQTHRLHQVGESGWAQHGVRARSGLCPSGPAPFGSLTASSMWTASAEPPPCVRFTLLPSPLSKRRRSHMS